MDAKEGDKRLGNQFWKLRAKHGRDKLFKTPELLWEAACEYFQWIEDHPLMETKGFAFQGVVTREEFPIIRAMTLKGLCFYLNTNDNYFNVFKAQLPKDEKDFNRVIKDIENVIYSQKFEGAAANLLNANIIARDLGLAEHTESKHEITTDDARDFILSKLNKKAK